LANSFFGRQRQPPQIGRAKGPVPPLFQLQNVQLIYRRFVMEKWAFFCPMAFFPGHPKRPADIFTRSGQKRDSPQTRNSMPRLCLFVRRFLWFFFFVFFFCFLFFFRGQGTIPFPVHPSISNWEKWEIFKKGQKGAPGSPGKRPKRAQAGNIKRFRLCLVKKDLSTFLRGTTILPPDFPGPKSSSGGALVSAGAGVKPKKALGLCPVFLVRVLVGLLLS